MTSLPVSWLWVLRLPGSVEPGGTCSAGRGEWFSGDDGLGKFDDFLVMGTEPVLGDP